MNKKVFSILILCVFFALFWFFQTTSRKTVTYKILDVVEADEFYIDINRNNKIDNNELFKLRDIIAFQPVKNDLTIKNAQKLNISIQDYLKNGYLAQNWAKEEWIGKYVEIVDFKINNKNNYLNKKVTLKIDNKNLAYELAKRGLATVNQNCKNALILSANSRFEMKNNLKAIEKIKFYALNPRTDIAHDITSEHFYSMKKAVLILEKHLKNHIPCKSCFNKVHFNFANFSKTDEFNIPNSLKIYKTSINKDFGNLELFLINPLEFSSPSIKARTKLANRITEEINNSKNTIDIALYGIGEQKDFIKALQNARKRGVKIRAVVDYSKNMDNIYPETKDFIKEFQAKTDKNEILMHNKFIIFDNKKVFTGSINISPTGTGGYNSNSAVIIKNENIAKEYLEEFEQMYEGKFSKYKKEVKTAELKTKNYSLKAFFLPKSDIYNNEICPSIQNAKEEIIVSIFYLTDKDLIEELIKAKQKGIRVIILSDAVSATNFKDRIITLRKANIPVKVENWGGKNHEKTILIDSKTLFLGSANFSKSGFFKNDENVLMIKSSQIGKFYRDYFLYLFNSVDNKFYYTIPRAEGKESKNSCSDGLDNNYDGKIDKEDEGCK